MGKKLTFLSKFWPYGDNLVTQLLVQGIAMQPPGTGVPSGQRGSLGWGWALQEIGVFAGWGSLRLESGITRGWGSLGQGSNILKYPRVV